MAHRRSLVGTKAVSESLHWIREHLDAAEDELQEPAPDRSNAWPPSKRSVMSGV